MISDAHDPRVFRRWVQFNADGTIAATHEFVADVEQPFPHAVDVTSVDPAALSGLRIDDRLVSAMVRASEQVALAAIAQDVAASNLREAQAATRAAVSEAAAGAPNVS